MEHNIQEINSFFHLEQQLREKLYDLQEKTDALEKVKKELLETRYALYNTEVLLENERRNTIRLKVQSTTAIDIVNYLEEEKMKNQVDSLQLQINFSTILKERDTLIKQTKIAKLETMEYKIKLRTAENNMHTMLTINKNLEESLLELKNNISHTTTTINYNIAQLRKEHQYLRQSFQTTVDLNKRLQTVGLCAHGIHQKDKRRIESLHNKLASLETKNIIKNTSDRTISHSEIQTLYKKLRTDIDELKLTFQDNKDFDEKFETF